MELTKRKRRVTRQVHAAVTHHAVEGTAWWHPEACALAVTWQSSRSWQVGQDEKLSVVPANVDLIRWHTWQDSSVQLTAGKIDHEC